MKKIVLFGDSILAGFIDGKVTDNFTDRIQSAFPNTKVINRSIPGHRTSDAITHVDRDVVQLKPDVVVLSFGVNDILTINEMKPGHFTNNLTQLIETIGPEKVVLVSPPYVDYHKQPTRSWPRQLQFELASEHIGKKFNVPFINLLGVMQASDDPNQYLQNDGLHFSAAGYTLLAKKVIPAIEEVLNQE